MTNCIRLCLVLHNHQPIGNFDEVFEHAYRDSYRPFLDVFEGYEHLQISLHTSGPLIEWLNDHHPEYLDRLARLVEAGRVEIVGGAFYEPILTMIPSRDRIGQITSFADWLENRLGGKIRGAWVPERVWEQSLTGDLAEAGVQYTVLDDFHFRGAGLTCEQLHGYYVTEDDGQIVSIFPGSERLRYLIPFRNPEETIEYLRGIAEQHPHSVMVFGDDGEKFGTWPETNKHCYQDGWLRRFFDALSANRDWLKTTTLAEAVEHVLPIGKVYLPDASYREMTEWALPVNQQLAYDRVVHELQDDPRWQRIQPFVRGGFWRNFRVKYPEANEMYSRMMMVSRRVAEAERRGLGGEDLYWARRELYRGQCNCSYWHGAFGGIYLPHLRNAVYNHLIAADNLLDRVFDVSESRVAIDDEDFDFDGRREVRLTSDRVLALLAPASGGHLYELDIRPICHNLLATLTRRPEAYHRKVVVGGSGNGEDCASIHDRVVFKQAGLDRQLQYDLYPRKSMVDHFFDNDATLDSVSRGEAMERGDFAAGVYEAKLRRSPDRVQAVLTRHGNAWGIPLTITKGIKLAAGSSRLEIAYLVEGLPPDALLHLAIEFNFAGMPWQAEGRYFTQGDERVLGDLGSKLDLHDADRLELIDQWLGLGVHLTTNRPTGFWTFPVATVSQSESGIELVHQSVAVLPHWLIRGDSEGRWSVTFQLDINTSAAESRQAEPEALAATV